MLVDVARTGIVRSQSKMPRAKAIELLTQVPRSPAEVFNRVPRI